MTLKVALVIDGDASGAKAAAAEASQAIGALGPVVGAVAGANDNLNAKIGVGYRQFGLINSAMRSVFDTVAYGVTPMQALAITAERLALSAGNEGVGAVFASLKNTLAAMLTPTALATAGIIALGGATVLAATQYNAGQKAVAAALTGIGQASGATIEQINQIGAGSASAFGLSIAEARSFAATLAATGQIGVAQIEPLVKLGHDVALAYGGDAAKAAEQLASAFADPAKGADELNKRLGFLDAATKQRLVDLQAQGRLTEAQTLAEQKLAGALTAMQPTLQSQASFWTAIGNAISNAWDAFGNFAAHASGIGLTQGLQEQIAQVKASIADLEEAQKVGYQINPGYVITDVTPQLEAERAKLAQLTAQWSSYQGAVEAAQQRRDSFAQSAAVRATLPEIDAVAKLNDRYLALAVALDEVNRTGGAASPVLAHMGLSFEQLGKAVAEAKGEVDAFKSSSDKAIAGLQLQIEAVGKHSPQALGALAYRETLVALGSNSPQAVIQAQLAQMLAIKTAQQQIVDSQKQGLLAAQQKVESAALELSILGQSSAEQDKQRADLQAKQQLEQEALRIYGDRDAYDKAHLAALEKEIAAEAQLKQALAEQQAIRDAIFAQQQIGRTADEQQIATTLRAIYGDKYQQYMDGAIAAQMRFNAQLQVTHDIGQTALSTFLTDLAHGKSLADAARDAYSQMLDTLIKKLSDLAFNQVWNTLFGGGAGGGSGFAGGFLKQLFGFGGGASNALASSNAAATGASASDLAYAFGSGGWTGNLPVTKVAGFVHGDEFVFDAASTRAIGVGNLYALMKSARGYAEGGFVGTPPSWLSAWTGAAAAPPAASATANAPVQTTNFYVATPDPKSFAEDRINVMRGINRTLAQAKRYS